MELKKYITYEEPLEGKSFTINQLHEVYRDLVDKEEYQDFDCWFTDMLKSGVCKANDRFERNCKNLGWNC